MMTVAVIGGEQSMAGRVVSRLRGSAMVARCVPSLDAAETDVLVYLPRLRNGSRSVPDLVHAEQMFQRSASLGIRRAVIVSSAAVQAPSHHNPGLIGESPPPPGQRNRIANQWAGLEALAASHFGGEPEAAVTILRPSPVLTTDGKDYFSRLFEAPVVFTLPGHDPCLQLLNPEDLAEAICCAVERGRGGIYNVAPDGVIPLRAALRAAGVRRIPVPRLAQSVVRRGLAPLGLAWSPDQIDYIRYSWTVSNDKIKRELGFTPRNSSFQALRPGEECPRVFDDFGMDENYIAAFGRTIFRFLERRYWRIEAAGLGHLPRQGRAVLVGMHRGFMPLDAVMTLHVIVQATGRIPRFLIHPSLIKFPFLYNCMTKLGGMLACRENADYVLRREGLLGIYPEGIRGAFKLYRDAYSLGKFGRDEFVKMALRHQAPLVPFVTIGTAEIFPILARMEWGWWKRLTEWPYFPITPTWPLLPLPLPSKWHMQFLPPFHVEDHYPPSAAEDPAAVRAISREVRARMQAAVEWILRRRKSIFFGSVFEEEESDARSEVGDELPHVAADPSELSSVRQHAGQGVQTLDQE